MGWLQDRKARKTLKKLGMSDDLINDTMGQLKQGMQDASAMRDDMRKLESPTYHKLIAQINDVIDKDGSAEQKKQYCIDLISNSPLTEYERNDLLTQVKSIFG